MSELKSLGTAFVVDPEKDYDASKEQAMFFFQDAFEAINKAQKLLEENPTEVTDEMIRNMEELQKTLDESQAHLDSMQERKVFCLSRLSAE